MNIFRLLGDLSHLLAIIILLLKIWKSRSCAGISGKSQILFSVVYTTRYLDLLTTHVSPYNTVMKLVFIFTSYATIYLMYCGLFPFIWNLSLFYLNCSWFQKQERPKALPLIICLL
uniref:KDEL endoplasmic reticulum protein retention receptor 2b n=1 Tax=Bombyx mori TaxID=7091 RepID=Q2F603_BOMMO|nr:KDEL endoplasmic reticulum protein retention receptor 2b [Bombyx mori]